MLYALSVPLMDVYNAAEAPARGAPFMCLVCGSRVGLRRTISQRPHWSHGRSHKGICSLRRDVVSGSGWRRRTADEINTYKGSRHRANT